MNPLETQVVDHVVCDKSTSALSPFSDACLYCDWVTEDVVHTSVLMDGEYVGEKGVVLEISADMRIFDEDWNT